MSSHQEELLDLIATEALIEREKLSLDAPLDSLGIDSVDFVSIMFAVEEKYNITVEDNEIARDKTLGDMIALLESKIEATGAPKS
jgi:acyl carrier protein